MHHFQLHTALLIAFVGLSLTSCTIESETHFTKSYSGSQIVSVDVNSMMEMLSSFGNGESEEMTDVFSQMNDPDFADSLAMMEDSMSAMFAGTGAHNFSIAVSNEGVMSIGFEFEDLETFDRLKKRSAELANRSGSTANDGISEMMSGLIGGNFSLNGKWLTIPFTEDDLFDDMKDVMPGGPGSMSDDEMEQTLGMMEGLMGGSITFENTYTFERNIKKIKGDIPYIQEGNKLTVKYSLSNMMDWMKEEQSAELKIKLK